MTFDITKPANNQKIRLGPQDIRDNFTAIAGGDNTFTVDRLNIDNLGANPTAFGDGGIFYVTDSGDGSDPEMFYKNDADSLVQLTQDNNLGCETAALYATSIRLDTDTSAKTVGINNMIVATATVDKLGSVQAGAVNMTTNARVSLGIFDVNVDADVLLNNNYRVIATVVDPQTTALRNIHVVTKAAVVGAMATTIRFCIRGSSALHDEIFDIAVIGGR